MNRFFLKVLNKFNLLEKINVEVPTQINKSNFLIPVMGKTGYSNVFISETWMIGLLSKIILLKKGVFVDVGVNIGQTLLKLRSINSDIPYIGFEPNPFCINYTSRLIDLNEMKNSVLMPYGVSDTTEIGVLYFFDVGSTDSTASMIAEFRPDQKIERRVFIPLYDSTKFNQFIGGQTVAFLKVDVEGAELEVLQSFKGIIKESNPFVLIEILPVYNKENMVRLSRQNQIEALLFDCAYSIFRILKSGNKIIELEKVNSFGIHSDVEQCDYLCVHSSYLNSVINFTF